MIVAQCSVCKLDPERLKTINDALRDATISLSEIARTSGIPKSNLYRHSRHLNPNIEPVAIDKVADVEIVLTKQEILRRIEFLWGQVVDGLQAAKEPITLTKPNGSKIEVNAGDLKARAAFLREGRKTLEAAADWSGYPRRIVSDQPGAMVQIIVPCPSQKPRDTHIVDIARPKRLT